MKKNWEIYDFEQCIEKVPSTTKIPKKKFLSKGAFPIISQEEEFINGYWNNKDDLFIVEKPVILFGDHTKIIKFIDFNFVRGADGIKIFLPKKNIDSKFFAYQLKSFKLENLGYARHYKLLKEKQIIIPPLSEQKQIVNILDKAFLTIDEAKLNAKKNLKNAKELFQSKLQEIFENGKLKIKNGEWEEKKLGEVCEILDKLRKPITKRNRIAGKYPYYGATGILDYVKDFIFDEKLILIGEDGAKWNSGDRSAFIVSGKYWVNNHAHVIKLDRNILIDEWVVNYLNFTDLSKYVSGMTVPKLNQGNLKQIPIPIPPLSEQQQIVQQLDELQSKTKKLEEIYQKKIDDLDELKKSILQKAFNAELT